MTYEEALQTWGKKRYGDDVTNVYAELGKGESGVCETCWYEYPIISVSYILGGKKRTHEIQDYQFSEFLQELLEVGQS